MIGKVPKAGRGFKGLVSYLLHGEKKQKNDRSRVAWIEMRNLLVGDPEKVPALMQATAKKSRRVRSPVYHYVISWHRRENPSDELMRQVADVTCDDLGLEEYQRLYIAHHDTAHKHVHIVVNRVHPETGKAWRTNHDYRRIEVSLRRQSEDLGLEYVPGRHNDPEKFRGKARRARDGEYQKARKEGAGPPMRRWDQQMVASRRPLLETLFARSRSWGELQRGLATQGLALQRKGQGIVITDGVGAMKLSQVGRQIRLKTLEKRFGRLHARPEPADIRLDRTRLADRDRSYEKLRQVDAETDMAFALYEMGLTSRRDVEKALEQRDVAQQDLDRFRSLGERLERELRETFSRKIQPQPPPKPVRKHKPRRGGRGR